MFTDVFEDVYKLRREVLCQIRGSACNYLYIEKSFQKLNSAMPNALESVLWQKQKSKPMAGQKRNFSFSHFQMDTKYHSKKIISRILLDIICFGEAIRHQH